MQRCYGPSMSAVAALYRAAVGSAAPSAAYLASVAASGKRSFHSTRTALALEEFFDASMMEGAARQPTGRPWEASELRLKSFEDLHKLWFVCLKERNMLLTERLYYRQVAQSAPEPSRLLKVRATMRAIKVVLGERARAAEMLKQDREIRIRAENEAARLATSIADSLRDPVERLLKPVRYPTPKPVRGPTRREQERAAALAAAKAEKDPRLAAAATVKAQAKNVLVTYKKWGRKYVVPADEAPDTPTAAQRKREARTRAFFSKRTAMLGAPAELPQDSAAYVWATEGRTPTRVTIKSKLTKAAAAAKAAQSAAAPAAASSS